MGCPRLLLLFALALPLLALSSDPQAIWSADPPTAEAEKATGNPSESTYQKEILPFLKKHCFACHGDGKAKADLSFDKYKDDPSVFNDRKVWDNVRHMLTVREMPPTGRPQPAPAEVEAVTRAIQGMFDRFDNAKPNAGRVTIRRLNKTEYNNTIRDLVGVDIKPADDFPAWSFSGHYASQRRRL